MEIFIVISFFICENLKFIESRISNEMIRYIWSNNWIWSTAMGRKICWKTGTNYSLFTQFDGEASTNFSNNSARTPHRRYLNTSHAWISICRNHPFQQCRVFLGEATKRKRKASHGSIYSSALKIRDFEAITDSPWNGQLSWKKREVSLHRALMNRACGLSEVRNVLVSRTVSNRSCAWMVDSRRWCKGLQL